MEVTIYAIMSTDNKIVKTSQGNFYSSRAQARQARKEVEGKARIVKSTLKSSEWSTAR